MTVANGNRIAAPLAMIYHTNEDIFFRAIDGLTADELWFCPTDKNTPMLWLAGHIAQTRAVVLQLMGEQIDTQWGELFARGSALKEMAEYPSASEIARTMGDVSAKLRNRLQSLDEVEISKPATGPSIPNAESVADQIAFFALHDTYHIGQMGYLRKALGYPGLVG